MKATTFTGNLPYGMVHVCTILHDTRNASESPQGQRPGHWIVRVHDGEYPPNELVHREYLVQMFLAFLHHPENQETQEIVPVKEPSVSHTIVSFIGSVFGRISEHK